MEITPPLDTSMLLLAQGLCGTKRPVVTTAGTLVGAATPSLPRPRKDGRRFAQCRAGGSLVGCEVVDLQGVGEILVVADTSGAYTAPWPLVCAEDAKLYFDHGVKGGVKGSVVAKLFGWTGHGAAAVGDALVTMVLRCLDGRDPGEDRRLRFHGWDI